MRREELEGAACRSGMGRGAGRDRRPGCRGTCAYCRSWGLLKRALRAWVGKDRLTVEAYINRFLTARRMPAGRRQEVRFGTVDGLATDGLRTRDGQLYFDAGTGRLCFKQYPPRSRREAIRTPTT
jgi:hypothetical protein